MPVTARLSPEGAQSFADRYRTFLTDASREQGRRNERSLAQRFWGDFFTEVCGVGDTLLAGIEFEYPVRKPSTDTVGWIDALWPGVVLIEHKSAGRDLDAAEEQAREYRGALDPKLRPSVIVVSDFFRFRVIEAVSGRTVEFTLDELPENLARFEAILTVGGVGAARHEHQADAKAAELMADLYVSVQSAGYEGHEVSVFLVRCLFLLFGDDTGLWRTAGEFGLFGSLVADSSPDGAGLGGSIQELFQMLDKHRDNRPSSVGPPISEFPYVNGGLFAGTLPVFSFTREMRKALLAAGAYDWSGISPAIFGAMFQNIKERDARRALGEHYTSEQNIMKVIGPLFLDDFVTRVDREWDSASGLKRFQRELGTYKWLDPACGCGNFLLVAYKRLRELELKVAARIQEIEGDARRAVVGEQRLFLRLSQFHGIEMVEWSSQIAGVALVLAEHQANLEMERVLGLAPDLLPLSDAASIRHENALHVDWAEELDIDERTFIMGNPPFAGAYLETAEQKRDQELVWGRMRGTGMLDFVSNWFLVAAKHSEVTGARCAFVATNSIAQGQQPAIIWKALDQLDMSIDFAHQTFRWTNGTREQAAVHTVIVGFSKGEKRGKRPLFTYNAPDSEPTRTEASTINAYLLDAPQVLITSRSKPLVPGIPPMVKGNIPTDDGLLSKLSADEADQIRREDPIAAKYLRPLIGAQEMLNGGDRWCLWLVDASPSDLRTSPVLAERIQAVHDFRSRSTKEKTRVDANRPWEFQEIRQPSRRYLAIPRHSSEHRPYLAAALYEPHVICNDAVSTVEDPSMEQVGLLFSHVFWVWALAVSGRLKSDPRISNNITYNNFPWPELTAAQATVIGNAARDVLTARSIFAEGTLADLYDPLTMPRQLRAAHDALDRAVGKVFGVSNHATDAAIMQKLFGRYLELSSGPLFPTTPVARRRRAA
jgi:hypothetical protein